MQKDKFGRKANLMSLALLSFPVLALAAPMAGTRLADNVVRHASEKAAKPASPSLIPAPHPELQFHPDKVVVGGTSKIVISIDNASATDIGGVSFTDDLPSGLVIAGSGAANYCGGTLTAVPNGTALSLNNGFIPAHITCVIYVDVVATAAGSWFDHTGVISSGNADPGDDVGATLTVTSDPLLPAPSVSTSFTPATFAVGGYSQLKISLTNNDPVNAVVGAQLFDNYLPGLASAPNSVVVSNDCSALVYPGNTSLRIFDATIPAGGSCSVIVKVIGATAANGTNQTGPILSGNASTAQGASSPFGVSNVPLLTPPSLALTLSSPVVIVGDTTDMKLKLTNPNMNGTINGAQYFQPYPSGVVNADTGAVVGNTCGGTLVALSGDNSASLSGAMIPAGASCDVTVRIKGLWANAYTMGSGVVYSGNAGQGGPVQATLTVNNNPLLLNPPGVTKSFAPGTVAVGDASAMTIALSNPNVTDITGVAFSDTYPPHMINASSGTVVSSNTCGGTVTALANGTSTQLTGGTVPPNGCSIVVNIAATMMHQEANHTGMVTSTNANTGPDASAMFIATYSAGGLLDAPTVTQDFLPTTVPAGFTSEMTITLSNANASAITGVQLSDTYPSGMVNADSGGIISNSCGGSPAAAGSGNSVTLSNGSIPAGDSCSIVVAVTGTAPGTYINHTGVVTSANADFSTDAVATLEVTDAVLSAPVVTKSFAPASVTVGGASQMTIELSNSTGTAITGIALTDIYPSGMINISSNPVISDSCNFSQIIAPDNGNSAALYNGTIAANDTCSVVIGIIGVTEGSWTNTTGPASSDNAQTATGASATLDVASPPSLSAPTVQKAFTPDSVPVGGTSLMRITLTNPNVGNAIVGTALDDIYPAGIVNASGNPVVSDSCNFNENVPASGGWSKLSGGTIAAGGSCSIAINVVGTATAINQTGAATSSNAPPGNGASATLTTTGNPLLPAPTATKTFLPTQINVGGTSQLTITLTNHSASAITGVKLFDVYPAGMANAPGNSVISDSCGFQEVVPPGGGAATLTGGTIPAGDGTTCSIVIDVIGTSTGFWTNWTNPVVSDNAASGSSTSATLRVTGSLLTLDAPVVSQSFSPPGIVVGGTSKLTITLSNPPTNSLGIVGVQFTDTYTPAIIANALSTATTDCGGVVTATPGSSSVKLSGGIIPANGSCSVELNVEGTAVGSSTSDTGTITSSNAAAGTNATTTLTVTGGVLLDAPTVQKSFSPANISAGDTSQMTIALTNPNASAVTGVQINDLYPPGIANAAGSSVVSDDCTFNEDVPPGGDWAKLDGGTIPAGGSCSIVIDVVGTATATNQIGSVPSGNAQSGSGTTATLTVGSGGGGNHPPVAVGDAIEVGPNGTSSVLVGDPNTPGSVLDNDIDQDGDTMTAVKLTDPANGTLQFASDGLFTYHANIAAGTDSFTYQACDALACSAPVTVTVVIGGTPGNHIPFAVDDAADAVAGGTTDVLIGDPNEPSSVLHNDIDPDGDTLLASKLSEPSHGTATIGPDGAFSYQNDGNDPATSDSVVYQICDPAGACDAATVTIAIGLATSNHAPVVVDDAMQVAPGGMTDVLIGDNAVPNRVIDNDSDPDDDPLTATKTSGLLYGSGTLIFNADASLSYQNDAASPATSDSFLYAACDDRHACTPGIVTITIASGPPDQAPSAADDAIEVGPHGTAVTLVGGASSVLSNDTDPDPGQTATLTAHLTRAPWNGHVTLNSDGTFVYVNDDPSSGFDSFEYETCDEAHACDGGAVAITIVSGVPTVTCILPSQLNIVGDAVNFDLSLLFAPPANDTLSYSVTSAPPTLSIIGPLLTGTLDTAGTFVSTLKATAVAGGGSASEQVEFRVLPAGDILLRNGFDSGSPPPPCQ
jgi:uncharacterized repeat protein (TIGR01451 family)